MPIPVCKRVRRKQCRKVKGKAYEGYISHKDAILAYLNGDVRFIAKRPKNMYGNSPEDIKLINAHRRMIETINHQLEKMGLQRLHAVPEQVLI